jgi:hypothetical protein
MKTILTLGALAPAMLLAAADAGSGAGSTKPTEKGAEAKTEAKTEAKAEPKRGIGTAAMEAILNSATNEEALAAVRKEFPDANTTKASINWYRNKARKDGMTCTGGAYKGKPVPNAREMSKDAKGAEPAKAADTKPKAADADPTA